MGRKPESGPRTSSNEGKGQILTLSVCSCIIVLQYYNISISVVSIVLR